LAVPLTDWATLLPALLVLQYFAIYVPRSKTISRALGLQVVVLLPLWPGFSDLYRLMAEISLPGKCFFKAYEIHVIAKSKGNPVEYVKALDTVLKKMQLICTGIFYWETSAPLPSSMRQLIKEKKPRGEAYWEKGTWPIPRAPGTALELRKHHARRGAIIWEKGGYK